MSLRRKVLFAFIATVLAMGFLEAAARLFEWQRWELLSGVPPPIPLNRQRGRAVAERFKELREGVGHSVVMVDDRERGWALPEGDGEAARPGGVTRTNSLGMRGPEVKPRGDKEQRLFTLGDSSIFGIGVPEKDVFSTVAARELTRRWGAPVSAVIGATPGYDSYRSLQTLKRHGARVQPTWVIIGNLWSDVFCPYDTLVKVRRRELLRGPLAGLSLYRMIRQWLPGLRPIRVDWMTSNFREEGASREYPACSSPDIFRDNLQEIVSASRKLKARVLFLILPAPMDFSGDIYQQTSVKKFRAVLREMAARYDEPLVDGPAVFKEAGAGLGWFLDNVHPSREGHILLGRAVADTLSRAWTPASAAPAPAPSPPSE